MWYNHLYHKKGDWDRMEVKAVFLISMELGQQSQSVLKSTKDAIKIVKEQGVLVGEGQGEDLFC